MSEDYAEHLAGRHATRVTPPEVVRQLVAEAASAPVAAVRRIVQGEVNEVCEVTLHGAPSLMVRISHDGGEAFAREAWVLHACATRTIAAPRLLVHRTFDVLGETRTGCVMERIEGEPLGDLDVDAVTTRRVLRALGVWLRELHAIPVRGFGYLDATGTGSHASLEHGLAGLVEGADAFEAAGRAVGVPVATIRGLLREIVDALGAAPPRVTPIHNDLLAKHVLVRDGQLAGVIDFGEAAAEPAAGGFAKWDFIEGDRFPVAWIREGYDDPSLFEPPNDRTYRALWSANGLWRMRWYHETGFRAGAEAARDRLLGPRPTS